ncbi:hypothetical protein DQ04_01101060 [Trypanosoma grayi]|uniref:hypothetical protein n=1 Tax=Trypanosoma grayi TaxID=71804 RepID=UPI0004F421BF|nr:hypothetical protein DQ04_01101060 [Trypanosoma grayi]KEG13285.1 hypothetical protein DQ04_01101060 [Trypanosoma grayi]
MDGRVKQLLQAAYAAAVPWEAAMHVALSLLEPNAGAQDVSLIQAAVGECMRLCILHHKAADALRIHELLNRSGHVVVPRRHRRVPARPTQLNWRTLQGLGVDELALVALQQQPYRAHQSMVVAQMIAAEEEDCDHMWDVQVERGRGAVLSASPTHSAVSSSLHITRANTEVPYISNEAPTEMTEAEHFRILLQQNIQLLRATQNLEKRLGLNYLLSQMRNVVDDKRLSAQIEVAPIVRIGRAVLDHPFVFTTPSTETARQKILFEVFGSLAVTKGLSEVQQARLAALEAIVDPVRPLCEEPLKFIQSLAASWDMLFVQRAAFTLVLPEEAHDVLPCKNSNISSRSSSSGGGSRSRLRGGWPGEGGPAVSAWTDTAGELFGGADIHDAAGRLELLISRRLHHNIVVPDTPFLLKNFNQLLQLAKHREVVIPHSVFLDVVHSALDDQGPRRFHSRRVLLSLMHATTTKNTKREWNSSSSPYSIPVKRSQGGVTLLGLQDEVALLEDSQERFFIADMLARQELGAISASCPGVASVLVAKQLERFVSPSHGHVTDPTAAERTSEMDYLVAGVIASRQNDKDRGDSKTRCGKPTPLFRSRSRAYWARTPVVLATTSEKTRRIAFMVGLSMFPPVSAE